MTWKNTCLLVVLLLSSIFCFANPGEKDKNAEPDIIGVVLAEGGRPLKDVNITAYNNSKKEKIATSDANGNFSLIDLKPGIYKFVFQKEGYAKVIREKVAVKYNEDYQLTIQMARDEEIFDLMPSPLRFTGAE